MTDETLASGARSGYVFSYRVTAKGESNRPTAYTVTAIPFAGCGKGGNCYFIDETGVIRQASSRVTDKNSPQLAF